MRASEIPGLLDLSTPERLLLVEELWEMISPDEILVPQSHKTELDHRLSRHKQSPGSLLNLEELQRKLEEQK